MINILEAAAEALLRNKSRSLLTILGIVIGVGAVITLVAIGDGLKKYVSGQFESLGTNIITLLPVNLVDDQGRPRTYAGGPPVGGKTFSERNLRDIRRLSADIQEITPIVQKYLRARSPRKQRILDINGSGAEYQTVRAITMRDGRFFSKSDVDLLHKVAVFGPTAARDFFGEENPVGKSLMISSVPFTVIGVTNPRGAGGAIGADFDDQVYVPYTTLQRLTDSEGIDFIVVQARSKDVINPLVEEIKQYLAKDRKPDTFSVVDQRQLLGTIQSILNVLTLGLGGIAAISLVVGGIGIMNMMLVTVGERTREIGLRKALGATRRVILGQFLAEAVILSLTGGVIGVMMGAAGSLIINRFFPTRISLDAVLLAFGISAMVGIIFGILPARRAAKMEPVEALRYE